MTGSVLLPGARERGIRLGDDYERVGKLWLPPSTVPEPSPVKPVGMDLFAGAGGFSCGFKQAGWHVAAALEGWATAACTYLVNLGGPDTVVIPIGEKLPEGGKRETKWHAEHRDERVSADEFLAVMTAKGKGFQNMAAGGGWIANQTDVEPCEVFYLGDVRALTGERALDDLGRDEIDCVFGGPPCQGFSRAGQQDPDDPRNELVFEFMRVVIEVQPKTFCMENVPGMMDMVTKEGVPVLDAIALMASEGGMGTFEAIRRSLAETAGVGAALRTQKVKAKGRPAPGISGAGRLEIDEDDVEPEPDPQLDLFGAVA